MESLERIADLYFAGLAPGQFMGATHPTTTTQAETQHHIDHVTFRL